jgi:hypothetical protein
MLKRLLIAAPLFASTLAAAETNVRSPAPAPAAAITVAALVELAAGLRAAASDPRAPLALARVDLGDEMARALTASRTRASVLLPRR